MCLTPIRIPTNKSQFNPSYDRMYNVVPCGKCSECLQQKRFSYELRAYHEYIHCKQKGGVTLYVTFTFNEQNVPFFEICGQKIRCFNKKQVQKFLDTLRKRIKRKYGANLTYLWCSEYGGNTHRPHYHALLFVDSKISHTKLRKWIRELWKYGFVKYGDNFGVVNRVDGIAYCCKYVTKDTDFFKDHDILLKELQQHDNFLEVKREFFPFHLQSAGLGMSFLGTLTPQQVINGRFTHTTKKGPKELPIPLYYTRKLLYTHDKKGCYTLTEFGAQVMSYRQSMSNTQYIKKINTVVNSIESLATDDLTKHLRNSIGLELTKDEIKTNIQRFRQLYTDEEIIEYKNNYRFFTRYRLHFPENDLNNIPIPIEQRYDKRYCIYEWSIDARSDKTCISNMDKSLRKFLVDHLYNHIVDMESYMILLDSILIHEGKKESETWFISETKFKQFKNQFIE